MGKKTTRKPTSHSGSTAPTGPATFPGLGENTQLRIRLNRARDERRLGALDAAELDLIGVQRRLDTPLGGSSAATPRAAIRAAVSVELGLLRERQGRRDHTRRLFEEAIQVFSQCDFGQSESRGQDLTDYGVALGWLESARAQAFLKQGEEVLRVAIKTTIDDTVSLITLAENLEAQGRSHEAANQFSTSAFYLAFTKRFDLALALIDRGMSLDRKNPASLTLKGQILHRMGRYDEALSVLDKACALDPRTAPVAVALLVKAEIQKSRAQYDRAWETLSRVNPNDLEDPGAWWKLSAELSLAKGDYSEAKRALTTLEAMRPGDAWTGAMMGQVLFGLKQYQEAANRLEKASKSPAFPPSARLDLVDALRLAGRTQEAREHVEQFLKERADDPELLLRLGQLQRVEEDSIDEAIESLRRAVKINPGLAQAYAELSEALRCKGLFTQALLAVDEALRLNENNSWAWRIKGAILNSLNRPAQALKAFDRSLEIEPQSPWGLALKGSLLSDLACYEEAIGLLSGVELPAGAALAWLCGLRGWALETLGEDRADETLEAYYQASANDPGNLIWKVGQANAIYLKDRNPDVREAADRYRKMIDEIKSGPSAEDAEDAETLSQLAWCHYRLKEYLEALGYYRRALELDDEMIPTRFDLGLALLCEGNDAAASGEYRRGLGLIEDRDVVRRRDLIHIAIEDLRQASRHGIIQPDDPSLRDILKMMKQGFDRDLNSDELPVPKLTPALRFATDLDEVKSIRSSQVCGSR
jgi:tetratricopeptide (TPR) repeat protein